jgi:hypothetical protein
MFARGRLISHKKKRLFVGVTYILSNSEFDVICPLFVGDGWVFSINNLIFPCLCLYCQAICRFGGFGLPKG